MSFGLLNIISAQNSNSNFGYSLLIGYPLGIFDLPGFGYHISSNLDYSFSKILSAESQISYTKMDYNRSDNIFSHDGGLASNLNLLIGLKLKFNNQNRKYHYYYNFLYGYGYGIDQYFNANNDYIKIERSTASISSSLNLIYKKRWNFSFVLESPNPTFLLRTGYKF